IVPYKHVSINPHLVVMGSGRYYLIATYDNSVKCYYFRVDLMTNIKITELNSTKRTDIPELKVGFNMSQYNIQHPYMVSGAVRKMKLRIKKEIFTQIVDWFGSTYSVVPNSETENTIDISVDVCEDAMVYWMMQYGENAEVLDMSSELKVKIRTAAKTIYEKYGK
ncbi:MAG: WYL domain-containing protein, partial [Clostridia bacterium]|nr:WYL domain-containing protein [Clostridia bacterium]